MLFRDYGSMVIQMAGRTLPSPLCTWNPALLTEPSRFTCAAQLEMYPDVRSHHQEVASLVSEKNSLVYAPCAIAYAVGMHSADALVLKYSFASFMLSRKT